MQILICFGDHKHDDTCVLSILPTNVNRAYKNAVEDDLWLALQQQSDEEGVSLPAPVKEIMDTWTLQMGFPLINVTRDYSTGGAMVSQVQLESNNIR